MPTIQTEHLFLQLLGVGQVAVVAEHDAEGRVHVERLRLGKVVGGTGSRVAHVADAHHARQGAHVAGTEDVAHQAGALVHVEGIFFCRGDTRRILATMLKHHQTVVEQLVYRGGRYSTENSAHIRVFLLELAI